MTLLTTRAGKGSALTHAEVDSNFKRRGRTINGDYTTAINDNRDVLEVTQTATISLTFAAAIVIQSGTDDYKITVKNISSDIVTVSAAVSTDTIDGLTDDIKLHAGEARTFKVNVSGNGYITTSYGHTGTITANVVGNVTGTVTGDVVGNADTADHALTADVSSHSNTSGLAESVANPNLTGEVTTSGTVATIGNAVIGEKNHRAVGANDDFRYARSHFGVSSPQITTNNRTLIQTIPGFDMFIVPRTGGYRFRYTTITISAGAGMRTIFYKNNVAVTTERFTPADAQLSWVEDISLIAGDVITLFGDNNNNALGGGSVRDLVVTGSRPILG